MPQQSKLVDGDWGWLEAMHGVWSQCCYQNFNGRKGTDTIQVFMGIGSIMKKSYP